MPHHIISHSSFNFSNSHSVQNERACANTIQWDSDGGVSHGKHQWCGKSGGVLLQCESPSPPSLNQTSRTVYCIYNMGATHPRFPHPHPVFEANTFHHLRSLILRGERTVMWAMVCGGSMSRGGYYLGVTKSQSNSDCYFTLLFWFQLKFFYSTDVLCCWHFSPLGGHE